MNLNLIYSRSFFFLTLPMLFIAFFTLIPTQNQAFAIKTIYEDFVAIDTDKIEISGDLAGEQLGARTAKADFNDDGIDDLIIASPLASTGDMQWNGQLRIRFGKFDGDSQLALPDLYFTGEYSGDQFGTSVAIGDFNSDGVEDIAIGAYNAQSGGVRPGKAYIIFGRSFLNSRLTSQMYSYTSIRDANLVDNMPFIELVGKMDAYNFGASLTSADINGDGTDDLLVGAPLAGVPTMSKAGAVYGYFGSENFIENNPNKTFYGQSKNEHFGAAITSGHLESNDKLDILIGAYSASDDKLRQTGKVYLYRDVRNLTNIIDSPSTSFSGNSNNEWFGFSLDTADLNGDMYGDVAIGSFPYTGDKSDAKISIFYGGENLNPDMPQILIDDQIGESMIGMNVLLDDLNRDGIGDIIFGAPGISKAKSIEPGDVYVIYSSEYGYNDQYSVKNIDPDVYIHGENADDWFGGSIMVMDINNDGRNELVIGSRYSDSNEVINNGKVFVLTGSYEPFGIMKSVIGTEDSLVTRAEFLRIVLDRFNLINKKEQAIRDCYDHREFCLFNFMTMSSFGGITLEPDVILYPDVPVDHAYFEDVTVATMLGIVNGYMNETNSPFYPEKNISRIQALKIILGATDLVKPKYQFELIKILGSYKDLINQISPFADVDARIADMWWYPRYLNFALEHDIIDQTVYFRPGDEITIGELNDTIERTLKYLNSIDEEIES